MVDKLVQLSEDADAIVAEALSDVGDRRVALSAMRESREIVAMIARLTGRTPPRQSRRPNGW